MTWRRREVRPAHEQQEQGLLAIIDRPNWPPSAHLIVRGFVLVCTLSQHSGCRVRMAQECDLMSGMGRVAGLHMMCGFHFGWHASGARYTEIITVRDGLDAAGWKQ